MSNQTEPSEKKKKAIIIIIIVAFAVMLTALVACAALLLKGRQEEPETTEGRPSVLDRGFITEDNVQEMMSEMEDKVEEGMFECLMTTTWTFTSADAEAEDAYVANATGNQYTFYFDVYESGTEELLYSSPMIPVGSEMHGIKLDKELSAGEHEAVVRYTMVDENYEEVSTVGFYITILINN